MRGNPRLSRSRVILNPTAGRVRRYPCVVDDLHGLPGAEIRRTRGPGHATELAREAVRDGCSHVVVAGGDGTVHEVVNGLVPGEGAAPDAVLAVVPLGTGNDLAGGLGIPLDPHEAVEILGRARTRRVDLLRVGSAAGERWVANFAIAGFAGDVAGRVTPETRRRWGGLVYLRAVAMGLPALRRYRTRLVVDGETLPPQDLLAVIVANGRRGGNGIPVAPRAEPDDGELDLVAVGCAVPRRVPLTVARVLAGRHLDSTDVLWRRARAVEIRSDPPMPVNGDGQGLGDTPVTFRVLPGALGVLVPPRPRGKQRPGGPTCPIHARREHPRRSPRALGTGAGGPGDGTPGRRSR